MRQATSASERDSQPLFTGLDSQTYLDFAITDSAFFRKLEFGLEVDDIIEASLRYIFQKRAFDDPSIECHIDIITGNLISNQIENSFGLYATLESLEESEKHAALQSVNTSQLNRGKRAASAFRDIIETCGKNQVLLELINANKDGFNKIIYELIKELVMTNPSRALVEKTLVKKAKTLVAESLRKRGLDSYADIGARVPVHEKSGLAREKTASTATPNTSSAPSSNLVAINAFLRTKTRRFGLIGMVGPSECLKTTSLQSKPAKTGVWDEDRQHFLPHLFGLSSFEGLIKKNIIEEGMKEFTFSLEFKIYEPNHFYLCREPGTDNSLLKTTNCFLHEIFQLAVIQEALELERSSYEELVAKAVEKFPPINPEIESDLKNLLFSYKDYFDLSFERGFGFNFDYCANHYTSDKILSGEIAAALGNAGLGLDQILSFIAYKDLSFASPPPDLVTRLLGCYPGIEAVIQEEGEEGKKPVLALRVTDPILAHYKLDILARTISDSSNECLSLIATKIEELIKSVLEIEKSIESSDQDSSHLTENITSRTVFFKKPEDVQNLISFLKIRYRFDQLVFNPKKNLLQIKLTGSLLEDFLKLKIALSDFKSHKEESQKRSALAEEVIQDLLRDEEESSKKKEKGKNPSKTPKKPKASKLPTATPEQPPKNEDQTKALEKLKKFLKENEAKLLSKLEYNERTGSEKVTTATTLEDGIIRLTFDNLILANWLAYRFCERNIARPPSAQYKIELNEETKRLSINLTLSSNPLSMIGGFIKFLDSELINAEKPKVAAGAGTGAGNKKPKKPVTAPSSQKPNPDKAPQPAAPLVAAGSEQTAPQQETKDAAKKPQTTTKPKEAAAIHSTKNPPSNQTHPTPTPAKFKPEAPDTSLTSSPLTALTAQTAPASTPIPLKPALTFDTPKRAETGARAGAKAETRTDKPSSSISILPRPSEASPDTKTDGFDHRIRSLIEARRTYDGLTPEFILRSLPQEITNLTKDFHTNPNILQFAIYGSFLYKHLPKDLDLQVVTADGFIEGKTDEEMKDFLGRLFPGITCEIEKHVNPRTSRAVWKLKAGRLVELTFIEKRDHEINQNWVSNTDAKVFDLKRREFTWQPSFVAAVEELTGVAFNPREIPQIINHKAKDFIIRLAYQKHTLQDHEIEMAARFLVDDSRSLERLPERVEEFSKKHPMDGEELTAFHSNLQEIIQLRERIRFLNFTAAMTPLQPTYNYQPHLPPPSTHEAGLPLAPSQLAHGEKAMQPRFAMPPHRPHPKTTTPLNSAPPFPTGSLFATSETFRSASSATISGDSSATFVAPPPLPGMTPRPQPGKTSAVSNKGSSRE